MQPTKPYPSKTVRVMARWIGVAAALLVAAIILLRFIDTLHVSIQRGQDLRAGVYTSATTDHNADIRLADASAPQRPNIR